MFNKRGWPRKKILSLIAFGFAVSAPGVFSQTGGTGSPDQNTMFTDNVPAQAAETPSYMLNPSFEFGLGNVAGKNYEVWGNKGRAYVKSGLELTKPLWGPLFFLGQAYHSMGLDMPAPSNLLELKLAPLFYFPQFNLLAGFQLYGMIPLYEGRLVADGSQVSDDFLFQNVGNMGINAGAYYMLPLDFGSIYGSLLFTFGRSLVASKWLLQGDLEAGVKTNMGLGGYVSPLFTFLLWGEDPEDNLFSNLEIQINYAKPLFPYSGSLSLLFPGGQKNGLKNNGVSVVPKFQFSYGLLFDVWASVELGGIGRSGGNGVSLSPKVGAVYHYVHSAKNTALSGGDYPPGVNEADPRWYIGAAAGYANNQLYTSTAGRTYTEYENGHGFDIAIPARYQFNPWFGAQAELAYIRKNYTLRRTGSFAEMYNEVSNGFIELPLMAHFSLGWENIRFFANTGAYFGFWTDSYRKGVTAEKTNDPWQPGTTYYYEYEEDAEFDDRRDARFDAGLLLGLGIQYAFKVCTIFLEGRYYYGVTDLQQNYQYDMVPRMNNTFSIRAGVLFNRNMFGLIRGKGK